MRGPAPAPFALPRSRAHRVLLLVALVSACVLLSLTGTRTAHAAVGNTSQGTVAARSDQTSVVGFVPASRSLSVTSSFSPSLSVPSLLSCTWSPRPFSEPEDTASSTYALQDCRTVWSLSNAEQVRRLTDDAVLAAAVVLFGLGVLVAYGIGKRA